VQIEANRNFANKLWNCVSFVVNNALKDVAFDSKEWNALAPGDSCELIVDDLPLPERWIINRCDKLIASVTKDLEGYNFGVAGGKIYEFLWDDYADWYVEISKTRLYEGLKLDKTTPFDKEQALMSQKVLVYAIDRVLRVLHPFMPFVTEHLFHHIPRRGDGGSLMLNNWPSVDEDKLENDATAATQAKFDLFQKLIRSIRNARAEYKVEQGKKIEAFVLVDGTERVADLSSELASLVLLAKIDPETVKIVERGSEEGQNISTMKECVVCFVDGNCEAILPRSSLIDADKEKERLKKGLEKGAKEIEKLKGRLSGGFVDKAPAEVVQKARDELAELEAQQQKMTEGLSQID